MSETKISSSYVTLSASFLCYHDSYSVSELYRVTVGRIITWFTLTQHTKYLSLLTLDALCKMAAVFWPTSEVASVKNRLRAPHPPFREEILYSAVSSHGTALTFR